MCILFIGFLPVVSYGQNEEESVERAVEDYAFGPAVSILLDKMNILYSCVENPYRIMVDGYSSKDLILMIDNGKIKQTRPAGGIIIPENEGRAIVSVNIKTATGVKEIQKVELKVRARPLPYVTFAGLHRRAGEVNKERLCKVIAPVAFYAEDLYAGPILRFTVVVRRDTNKIFERTMEDSNGTKIDGVTNQFFQTLQRNDKVYFTDIMIEDCDSMFRYLEPVLFIISEISYSPEPKRLPNKYDILVDPTTGEEVKRRR